MRNKHNPEDAGAILNQYIPGYHEYTFGRPARVSHAGRNLCGMLGYSREELVNETADYYEPLVHPADCGRYRSFLDTLASKECTRTLAYRIVKRSGEILYVADTMTSRRQKDGTMKGFSTLANITSITDGSGEDVRFINDTVPCGMLRYTCEKTPKVTYANTKLREILRLRQSKDDAIGQADLYRSNIYMAISPESRNIFAQLLQKVFLTGTPEAGEVTVVRGDGSTGRLFGWVTKYRNADGQDEFQSICIDITESWLQKKDEQTDRFLNVLSGIYDLIFEFDREKKVVRYLHGTPGYLSEYPKGLPLVLEEATQRWLNRSVAKEDRIRLRRFLVTYIFREKLSSQSGPPQIHIRIKREDGTTADFNAIILQAEPSTFFFCCRELHSGTENSLLRRENDSLINQNEQMQELVRRFTDGMVAFEVTGDRVKPLYYSDNVGAFFGYSREQWERLAEERPAIRDFVARTGVEYERFEEVLQKGEGEFIYRDTASGESHKIRAVCSNLNSSPDETKYVMLYLEDDLPKEKENANRKPLAKIRTFGYFDVFVDGRPIMFKTEKAKELLAILVDRRGGYVTPDEVISLLWEDEPASALVLARYRKVALRLKNQLEEYGVQDIVESVNGKRRIVSELVDCDFYRYLSGSRDSGDLFHGSYMTNYSWAETTLGGLELRD